MSNEKPTRAQLNLILAKAMNNHCHHLVIHHHARRTGGWVACLMPNDPDHPANRDLWTAEWHRIIVQELAIDIPHWYLAPETYSIKL